MRSSLASMAMLGLLAAACADDVGEDGPEPTTNEPPPSTTMESTGSDSVSVDESTTAAVDSTTGDTESVDESTTGPGIECGDGMVEGDEICDGAEVGDETCATQGFDGGEFGCLSDCTGYDTRACLTAVCGDGVAVGSEPCDGTDTAEATCRSEGFDSGTLVCNEACTAFDTSGCGLCGNNQVDGAEPCDGVWLEGQTCTTQGFTSGTIACAPGCEFDTTGCGQCSNGLVDGDELCDGMDLGGSDCTTLGFTAGELSCQSDCVSFDVYGCGVQQFDVSAPTVSGTAVTRFRGNGYLADGDGVLVDFAMYLGLAAPCDLDFYVYEAPMYGGPYTQVARTTVPAAAGTDYYMAGIPLVPVTAGSYYVLGVGWACATTSYWNSTGAFAGADGGLGLFNVSHWDNAYPGPSDAYLPPNVGPMSTVYVQRVFFGT